MIKYFFLFSLCLITHIASAQESSAKAYFVLTPMGDFVGKMKITSGNVVFQDGKYKAKNIIVDLNSLVTGMDLRDEHAKNKYLETKKYPTAVLMDAIGANGAGKARIKIRDKESVVNGTYKISSSGKSMKAEFVVKLSSFGISDISFKGIGVDDDVRIEVIVPVVTGTAAPEKTVTPAKATVAPPATAPAAKAVAPVKPSTIPPKK